jgi:nitrite reductase/ring-hydroxylating ferredoxin subunit/uncharacterized membrane protein
MLKNWLQGRPVGHPLHPLLIHFPLGLFLLSLVFDIASWVVASGNPFVHAAFYTLLAGVLTALLAATAGLADWLDIRRDSFSFLIATAHMLLNLWAVTLYAFGAWVRWWTLGAPATPKLPLAISLVALAVLGVSGWMGGHLIYSDGVAVGRHRRATPLPRRTQSVHTERAADALVPLFPEQDLPDGHTRRVELNGQIIAVVRSGGQFYAFQEFCTHRYGPLSEGALHDGQVICPWHQSRFDMATGKLLDGPATVGLRTFPIVVHNGTVHLRATDFPP